jgi:hypothetical protein
MNVSSLLTQISWSHSTDSIKDETLKEKLFYITCMTIPVSIKLSKSRVNPSTDHISLY